MEFLVARFDRATGTTQFDTVTLERDESNRPQTTLEDLAKLEPVFESGQRLTVGKSITAGNAHSSRVVLRPWS